MRHVFIALAVALACLTAQARAQHYSPVGSIGSPSLGACGVSPSVTGTDAAGIITIGTGIVTSCVLNFSTTLSATPSCIVITDSLAVTASIAAVTMSALTMGLSASLPGGKLHYHCFIK